MQARSPAGGPAAAGTLVRPLLEITREETAAHCRARGLTWTDDATNDSDAYARGRVRAGLVPALEAVHPGAQRNVIRAAALLREEAEVLDDIVDTALAGRDHVTLDHLRILPRALGRLVLRRLAEDAVGGLCPRVSAPLRRRPRPLRPRDARPRRRRAGGRPLGRPALRAHAARRRGQSLA